MNKEILITGYFSDYSEVFSGYIIAELNTGIIKEYKTDCKYEGEFMGERYDYDSNYIIYPGDFNAHSHPEQSLYTDIVDKDWNLATWCKNTIYKYSINLTPNHVYLACSRAFSRMLSLGVTTVMVSFYCHGNEDNIFDKEVIRAGTDSGIRLYYGRMNYDVIDEDAYGEKKASQTSFFETPERAEENYKNLLQENKYPTVEIAPSVHSIHASTKEAIVRAINLGNKYDKYIQFHLSEDVADVELSLKLYGKRPIEFLLNLLENGEVESLSRVMLSDCVWINTREREIIKEQKMIVVLNPRMNHRIKTGEADLIKFIFAGIIPYLGTDGEASNDDLSITGEREYLKKRYSDIDSMFIDKIGTKSFRFKQGYIGEIKTGNFCDVKVLKVAEASEVLETSQVADVFVGGNKVLASGRLVNLDVEKSIEMPLRKLFNQVVKTKVENSIEEDVGELLIKKGFTIATAESCTGGLLAGKLINYPGISAVFMEGTITYSNEAKIRNLNVKKETLNKYGAVSRETAEEMAIGIAKAAGTDVGVSVTGLAGPGGGTERKPVGLVYVGLYIRGEVKVKELHLLGNRQKVREDTVMAALRWIKAELMKF
jgi:5-methylthioadenosine/S-adenosylhomocysteine deaminase